MTLRRGGRVVECTALEMRHTREGIVGSNPTLSASNPINSMVIWEFVRKSPLYPPLPWGSGDATCLGQMPLGGLFSANQQLHPRRTPKMGMWGPRSSRLTVLRVGAGCDHFWMSFRRHITFRGHVSGTLYSPLVIAFE